MARTVTVSLAPERADALLDDLADLPGLLTLHR